MSYYDRHKDYFRNYYRRYWRTHPEYRKRQVRTHREHYRRNREAMIKKTKEYVASIYRNWFGEIPRNLLGGRLGLSAERIAVQRILPEEGFTNILWAFSLNKAAKEKQTASNFGMFDAFAFKGNKRCAFQITTSPFRQIRNRTATSAFLKFFDLQFYICVVRPNLKQYYLGRYEADQIPLTIIMTPKRIAQLKSVPQ